MRDGALAQPELRGQIDRQRAVPIVLRHGLGQRIGGDPGIVHQDVELAEAGIASADDRLAGVARRPRFFRRCAMRSAPPCASARPLPGRSTASTWAPSSANSWALAAPIPEAAPVTMATRSAGAWRVSSIAVRAAAVPRARRRAQSRAVAGALVGGEVVGRPRRKEPGEWGLGGLIRPGFFVHAVDRHRHYRARKRLAHGSIVTF